METMQELDENGNPMAGVFGGPLDGAYILCKNLQDGNVYAPPRAGCNRPVYTFSAATEYRPARFVFTGWFKD